MTAPETETGVTIERLDGRRLEELEPLWRSLIDHIRELGSVVAIVPHGQSWPRRRAIYEELLSDGQSFALGARRDGSLIGYAMVHVAPPDAVWYTGERYAELMSLCVAEKERGGGLGTALLDAVEAGLLERGLDQYVIGVDTVNPEAQRFYERRGFRDGFHLMHGWVGGERAGNVDPEATASATPDAATDGTAGAAADAAADADAAETALRGVD